MKHLTVNCTILQFLIGLVRHILQTHSIEHSTPDHINMGVSKIHKSEGHEVQMVSGYVFFWPICGRFGNNWFYKDWYRNPRLSNLTFNTNLLFQT